MAVRIATEIGLHRSIFKALDGDRNHYLRTRLWYLCYVCDHQFSVAYGRPPMTRECDAIRASLKFLDTEHAVEDDARLICEYTPYQSFGEKVKCVRLMSVSTFSSGPVLDYGRTYLCNIRRR